jgi:hypothetical protein
MGNWNEFQQPDPNLQRLRNEIVLLSEVHSKRLSDEAMSHWVKRLLQYATGQALWTALERARDERTFPSVGWVLEERERLMRVEAKPYAALPELTPDERKRSDNAAVLSMLWLHYARGWELERVGAETIARLLAQQTGRPIEDIPKMLAAAKEIYPRDLVMRWMVDQERAGN